MTLILFFTGVQRENCGERSGIAILTETGRMLRQLEAVRLSVETTHHKKTMERTEQRRRTSLGPDCPAQHEEYHSDQQHVDRQLPSTPLIDLVVFHDMSPLSIGSDGYRYLNRICAPSLSGNSG